MESAGVQCSVWLKTSAFSKLLLIFQFFLAKDLTSCSLFPFSVHPLMLLNLAQGSVEIRSPEFPPSKRPARAVPGLPIHIFQLSQPFPARQGCPVLRDVAGILSQLEFFPS